jgi:nucleoid DNA-binding protein
MANEIVKMVAKKANLSESVAQIAVDTVLNVLKTKLPPAVGSTLDSFLGSGSAAAKTTKKGDNPLGGLGDIAGNVLGGLLGKK